MSARRGSSWGAAAAVALVMGAVHAGLMGLELVLLVTVVPSFEAMFADFGASLPAPTELVLSLSWGVRSWWFLWIPAGLAVLTGNTLLLAALARWRGALWSGLLGVLQALPLLVVPALTFAALYLPIFSMASAID